MIIYIFTEFMNLQIIIDLMVSLIISKLSDLFS